MYTLWLTRLLGTLHGAGSSPASPFKNVFLILLLTSTRPLCLKGVGSPYLKGVRGHPKNTEKHTLHAPVQTKTPCVQTTHPPTQDSSLQPPHKGPAWRPLVSQSSPLSPRSASSDGSHKSLGLDRLQGEDPAHQPLEGRSFCHFIKCVWVAGAKQDRASLQGTPELLS